MANDSSIQDCFDEVGKIAALYHTHNIPFTYADEWDLILLRLKCRRVREIIPLTPEIMDGIAAKTITWALFKRWVTTTFLIDPELPMSDARNVGSGDPPHELALMTDEEGLKRPIAAVKHKGKKNTTKKTTTTNSTFAPSGYTAPAYAPLTQSVWAEVGESPACEAITEEQAAIPYDLTKSNVKRFFEAKTIEDLQGRCFLTPHVTEFYWKEERGAKDRKVCRCVQGLGRDIGTRNKEDLALWMLDLTNQVDKASAETAFQSAKTCRNLNETWVCKGNYRQYLHQKEASELPASIQSCKANSQLGPAERKDKKLAKYNQIGQSLGAPMHTFVEAIQAMTAETRNSTAVNGPVFLQSVEVPCSIPTPTAADPACHNSFAALTSTLASDSEEEYEYEHDTSPESLVVLDIYDDFLDDDFFDALGADEEEEARAAQSRADHELALRLEAADEEEAAKCCSATTLEAAAPARPNNTPTSPYVYPTEPGEGGPSGWPTQTSPLTTGSTADEEEEARVAQIQADHELALRFKLQGSRRPRSRPQACDNNSERGRIRSRRMDDGRRDF
jgi:hypothetical protein